MLGPGQVFRDSKGLLWLFVRQEERKKVAGYLLVGARTGVVATRWVTQDEEPGELINDTAGRAEAKVFAFELRDVERDRDALKDTLRQAVQHLSPSQGEELRQFYLRRLAA